MGNFFAVLPVILKQLTPLQLFVALIICVTVAALLAVIWLLISELRAHRKETNEVLKGLTEAVKQVGVQSVESAKINQTTAQTMATALTSALLSSSVGAVINPSPVSVKPPVDAA